MLENEFYISKLIASSIRGTITQEEQKTLNAWRAASNHNEQLIKQLNEQTHLNEELLYFSKSSKASILEKVKVKLHNENKIIKYPFHKLLLRFTAAAAVLIIFGTVVFHLKTNNLLQSDRITYKNDIAPGTWGATLTLSNGKTIRLTGSANETLAEESGVVVTKTAEGQIVYEIRPSMTSPNTDKPNTLSTSNGETYILTLPDKTKVWLNSASSITYAPALIENGKRIVRLKGEGYFEVAKDKAHPFIVRTDRQNVEVLGTHFNISNYTDDTESTTTLLEGSVKISTPSGENAILIPGQQSVAKNGKLTLYKVNTDDAVAWSKGYFKFDNENIYSIMRRISRWYDVDIQYAGNFDNVSFFGQVSRSKNISSVLKILELSENLKFTIEGRRVLVMKK